jgi:1-acyl-sn-glycerol-3-phosphate acyltransferase
MASSSDSSMPKNQSKSGHDNNDGYYYKFDFGNLPVDLYANHVPVQKWLDRCTTVDKEKGFTTSSSAAATSPPPPLAILSPIPWRVEWERILVVSAYMTGNILAFVLPTLMLLAYFYPAMRLVLAGFVTYTLSLSLIGYVFFRPYFEKEYQQTAWLGNDIRQNQYMYTEHNSARYLSSQFVWPKTIHRPVLVDKPCIFCALPHSVAPMGFSAYPLFSKLWNDKTCHWACAPILLKLPIISSFVKSVGYIPAKSEFILETLTKKEENVGVVLDGIAGMFQPHVDQEELAYVKKRKGIIKIALKAGAPIIPVYAFGHTSLYSVLVDPFNILKRLSLQMEMSLTPFYGRFYWFLGPPRRIPVTVCLGEPVWCPLVAEPSKQDVDKYHQQLLDNYQDLFEKHKRAYGWGHKTLKFV